MMEESDRLGGDYENYFPCSGEEEHKSQKYPDYCRTLTIKGKSWQIKLLRAYYIEKICLI